MKNSNQQPNTETLTCSYTVRVKCIVSSRSFKTLVRVDLMVSMVDSGLPCR